MRRLASPHSPPTKLVPQGPLVVTRNERLLDAVLRVAATVGVEPLVVSDQPIERSSWSSASMVLLGDDVLASASESALPRRAGVYAIALTTQGIVGPQDLEPRLWNAALRVGASEVLLLPNCEAQLAERLSEPADSATSAVFIGVVGGCGGAGASTLAAAVALASADKGMSTLLVDGDPFGGGLDLLLGQEAASGSRWLQLALASGRVAPTTLHDVLPTIGQLQVLSWGRPDVDPAAADGHSLAPSAIRAVFAGAARGYEVVVVDLARAMDAATAQMLASLHHLLVVVPPRVRAVSAARSWLASIHSYSAEIGIVVRAPSPGGVEADDVAAVLEVPVVGTLRHDGERAAAEERGEPPASGGRASAAQLAGRLLDDITATVRAA